MMQSLQRLTYFSRNLLSGPRWRVDEQLGVLLTGARLRNRHMSVTGTLLFNDDCFAQILEGTGEALDAIYGSILVDARHSDVTLMQRQDVPERAFPDWAMQYVGEAPILPPTGAPPGETLFQRLATVVHGGA